jgi:phosphatidylethanolamine-binding protein (PEBP) family uncharacterized protein
MSRTPRHMAVLYVALFAALALSGCGSSNSATRSSVASFASSTPAASKNSARAPAALPARPNGSASTTSTKPAPATESVKEPKISIPVTSPAKLEPLSARYSCDGGNVSLPVSWGRVPANTVELDLFVYQFAPVNGKLAAAWAVAHLKPSLRRISAGQLPSGAIVGRNSLGQARYGLCPQKGRSVQYSLLLYALPRRIPVKTGFAPEALTNKVRETAEFMGALQFFYRRA